MAAPAASSHTPALAAAPSIAADASPSVAPDAAAASAHIPRKSPKPTVAPALKAFIEWHTVQQQYNDHFGDFLTLSKQLKSARIARDAFDTVTHMSDGNLPRSLQLRIVNRTLFPTVAHQPNFFKPDLEALQKLELDTAKQIAATILAAKQRHIEHLQTLANPLAFVTMAVTKFTSIVTMYADAMDKAHTDGAAAAASPAAAAASTSEVPLSSLFPRIDAIAHFERTLRERIDEELARQVQADHQAKTTAATKAAASHQAQETVMTGAHDGSSIAAIATREARKCVEAALKAALPQLPRSDRSIDPSSRTASPEAQPRIKKARTTTPASRQTANVRTDHNHAPDDEDTSMSDSPSNPFRFNFPPSVFITPKPVRGVLKRGRANRHSDDEKDDQQSDDVDMEDVSTVIPWSTSHPVRVPQRKVTFQRGGVPRNTQHRNQRSRTASPVVASAKRGGGRNSNRNQ